MKTFTASRVSDGNGVFPCKIIVGGNKITVRIPGLFSNRDKDIPFEKISEISVETPLVGYSTITFYTTGIGYVNAHGFTKSEVKEIKRLIEDGETEPEEEEAETSYSSISSSFYKGTPDEMKSEEYEWETQRPTVSKPSRVQQEDNSELEKVKKERAEFERQKLAFEKQKFNREKSEYEQKEIERLTEIRDMKLFKLAQILFKKHGFVKHAHKYQWAMDILQNYEDINEAESIIVDTIKSEDLNIWFVDLNRKNKPEAIKELRKMLPKIKTNTNLETKKSALRCLEELNRKYAGIEFSPRTLSIAASLRDKYGYDTAKAKMLTACGPLKTKK